MARQFDAIIIGTGQAGPSLAQRMTAEGMKTAIIERKLFGGACVNVGCIPTKALVASARAAHMARRGGDFGVEVHGPVTVDMAKVKARKDAIVAQSNIGVTNWLKNMENLTVFEGHGRLESANSVRVNGELLQAGKIILNVGDRAGPRLCSRDFRWLMVGGQVELSRKRSKAKDTALVPDRTGTR